MVPRPLQDVGRIMEYLSPPGKLCWAITLFFLLGLMLHISIIYYLIRLQKARTYPFILVAQRDGFGATTTY